MFFEDIKFGSALALLERIQEKHISIRNECISQNTRNQIDFLIKRTQFLEDNFCNGKINDFNIQSFIKGENFLEDFLILQLISKKVVLPCESFYKIITSSFNVYENFCTIFKDYINTKKQLDRLTLNLKTHNENQ